MNFISNTWSPRDNTSRIVIFLEDQPLYLKDKKERALKVERRRKCKDHPQGNQLE